MILLDTCAALWWVFDKDKFSKKSRSYIDKMEASFGYISSITIWEIGLKMKRKKIEMPISIEELTSRMKQSRVIKIVPVDETLWIKSLKLRWKNQDPADRVIVATSMQFDVPLITSDQAIRRNHKNTVW